MQKKFKLFINEKSCNSESGNGLHEISNEKY